MFERKSLIIIASLIILGISLALIIGYFILLKKAENVLEISKYFPYDTPIFFGIDNIQPRLKKIESSQTRIELQKQGLFDHFNIISRKNDNIMLERTGLRFNEWTDFIFRDAGIGIDYRDHKIVFLVALGIHKDSEDYSQMLETKLFAGSSKDQSIKKYNGIQYKISHKGTVICYYKTTLILSNNEAYFKEACDVIKKTNKSLAKNERFITTQQKLEYIGGYMGYINVEMMLRRPELFRFLLKKIASILNYDELIYLQRLESILGLKDIEIIGGSGDIVGEDILQKTYIEYSGDKTKGIIPVFLSIKPENLDADRIIPQRCEDFIIMTFGDAGTLYEEIETIIMQNASQETQVKYIIFKGVAKMLGIELRNDFIDSLNHQAVLAIAPAEQVENNPYIKNKMLLFAIKIKDKPKFSLFMKKLKTIYNDYSIVFTEEQYLNGIIYSLSRFQERGLPIFYGNNKDYFFLASDRSIIKDALSAYSGKDSISKSIKYKNCRSKAGKKNNFIIYSKGTLARQMMRKNIVEMDVEQHNDLKIALNTLGLHMGRECGQISSGINKENEFVIQSYFPLSYIYIIYLMLMHGLVS
ncbi:MAG: hypothetical protein A2Y62_20325 [Candidatus Fischerbacteria bacterium RBG_13_37_8]|uniref:DUF3352 domain-containing protein n=1 Tax=Candidatus Fischerbacteria bacterium RBG_13_37_8 TaxID=1817863 RepID=A0A1F5VVB1_9BACT|nr:MAG: hypothetical protein A2Y62_20325 [Candidatus Fischerbacteria bacterium RBG_13_37_8]